MLDRLRKVPDDVFRELRCENLLLALSDTLDETFRVEDERDLLGTPSWRQGEVMIPILLSRMGPKSHSVVVQAFREGRSIGWLVEVFRRETFAHGRFGERKRPEHEWLLSEKDYEAILKCMHERFGQMTLADIFATPQPISLLFAWSQTGGTDEARKLVQLGSESYEDFLKAFQT